MQRKSFDEQLEFGRRGERLVEAWLQSRGLACLPAYDFAEQGAPKMRCGEWKHAVPDVFAARDGRSFWFEIKTYTKAVINNRRQALVHGVAERLWNGYKQIATISGVPAWVLVLEIETCDLLGAAVDALDTWQCECPACEHAFPEHCRARLKRGVYWLRSAMVKLHAFTREQVEAVVGAVDAPKAVSA